MSRWKPASAVLAAVAACAAAPAAAHCAGNALREQLQSQWPSARVTLQLDAASAARLDAAGGAAAGCSVVAIDQAVRRRMQVVLELPPGAAKQRLALWFEVAVQVPAWRLQQAQPAGGTPDESALQAVEEDVVANPGVLVRDAARQQAWRMARALPEGHVLRRADVLTTDTVQRGDRVALLYRSGALELRASGTALATAMPGERLPVALDGRGRSVWGRLNDNGQVEVTP
ncbi:flagellar basal body P-ring formation chaperone FlgA [Methylibium rhizosphaerae]|uniref:flagellar basal body P-ring formation chaperone FlgA n=1 Tax=Methylibium rhizosphaerae TaxID=2570323 RepID=UPI0015E35877|nr:flagellar basal body P-ring formation chaperone FlgA [Methylibium rhizosphaerae]